MHNHPSWIISFFASNTTSIWECIAVTPLSTYSTQRAHYTDIFFFSISGIRFSFIVSCRYPAVSTHFSFILEGNVFVFPLSAPAWPYWSSSHHNKALWIISLGQLILHTPLSSTPAPAKSQWIVCSSAQLNQFKLMQLLLFEGNRLDVSNTGATLEAKCRTGEGTSN